MDWLEMYQQEFDADDFDVLKWRPKNSRFLKMIHGDPVSGSFIGVCHDFS
jgi:hypothetical protein